jgi:hypothetical protein
MPNCLNCSDPIELCKQLGTACEGCAKEQQEINARSRPKCEICLLNERGISEFNACPKMQIDPAERYTKDFEIGGGCKFCEYRCQEEAFYIGGKNICLQHEEAFKNRVIKPHENGTEVAS